MPQGGFRPGAGRPKKSVEPTLPLTPETANRPRKSLGGLTPLEFMLRTMNDPEATLERRDRAAVSAAPYVHVRAEEAALGKKEQRQAEAEERALAGGRYAPPAPPRRVN